MNSLCMISDMYVTELLNSDIVACFNTQFRLQATSSHLSESYGNEYYLIINTQMLWVSGKRSDNYSSRTTLVFAREL